MRNNKLWDSMVDKVLTKPVLRYDIMEGLEITAIGRFQRYFYKSTGRRCYVDKRNTSYVVMPKNEAEYLMVSQKLAPYTKGHFKAYADNSKHLMKHQGLTEETIQRKIIAITNNFAKEFNNYGKTYEYSIGTNNDQYIESTQAFQ